MMEQADVENVRFLKFQLLNLTVTLDRIIWHSWSTSFCTPNFIQIEKKHCERTVGRSVVLHYWDDSKDSTYAQRLWSLERKQTIAEQQIFVL